MEQTILNDFLLKQAPGLVILALLCYFMYKYFISQMNKKDATIADKDSKLELHQQQVMDLYGKAIEAQNRGNMVQEQLLDVLKETKEDINRLSDKL